jgi:hypothetical protein
MKGTLFIGSSEAVDSEKISVHILQDQSSSELKETGTDPEKI